jgi:hypothetical protein
LAFLFYHRPRHVHTTKVTARAVIVQAVARELVPLQLVFDSSASCGRLEQT